MGHTKDFRILLIDDDKDILELLHYNLKKEGFKVKVLDDCVYAVQEAKAFEPHLIILDIMMPHSNGFDVCKALRSEQCFENVYIFFLTAISNSYYQQQAFFIGADDYIEKVMGLRSLTHKINTVLKNQFIIKKRILTIQLGKLSINRLNTSVKIEEKEINLSQPEFELLFFLAQNNGRAISQKNLIHNIWGTETFLLDSSVDQYIQNLQHKLGPEIIEHHNNHYRFALRA